MYIFNNLKKKNQICRVGNTAYRDHTSQMHGLNYNLLHLKNCFTFNRIIDVTIENWPL